MQFSSLAAIALPVLALAAPAADVDAASKPKGFWLRAHVPKPAHPKSHSHFDGRYLNIYHTGAGFNDAQLLVEKPTNGFNAYISGSGLYLNLTGSSFPLAFNFNPDVQESAWTRTQISVGSYVRNATIADGKIKVQNVKSFLICDWQHGVPQLFQYESYASTPIPANCEFADLLVDYQKK